MDDAKNTVGLRQPDAFRAQIGKGRPKGVPNKNTAAIRDMIVQALDQAGGVSYLVEQAERNPGPFLALVGKVLPMQVTGEDGAAVRMDMNVAGAPPEVLRWIASQHLPDEDG